MEPEARAAAPENPAGEITIMAPITINDNFTINLKHSRFGRVSLGARLAEEYVPSRTTNYNTWQAV